MGSQCADGYVMLPDIEFDETMEFPKTFFGQPRTIEVFQWVNLTNDLILKVAAKNGDSWAIQSYSMGILTSSESNTRRCSKLSVGWIKHQPFYF